MQSQKQDLKCNVYWYPSSSPKQSLKEKPEAKGLAREEILGAEHTSNRTNDQDRGAQQQDHRNNQLPDGNRSSSQARHHCHWSRKWKQAEENAQSTIWIVDKRADKN